MSRALLFIALLVVFACGGGQDAEPAEAPAPSTAPAKAGAKPGAKAKEAGAAARAARRAPAPEISATRAALMDPVVSKCLAFIREANYDEALPVCREAEKKFPGNADVEAALELAQEGGFGPEFEE